MKIPRELGSVVVSVILVPAIALAIRVVNNSPNNSAEEALAEMFQEWWTRKRS